MVLGGETCELCVPGATFEFEWVVVQGQQSSGRDSSGELGVDCCVGWHRSSLDLLLGPVGKC